ncbi:MAG: hypothetical protein IPM06_18620 [Rhizobiales bacterium]|nr:hypothetical protein [Hyphomicrobiales bacterium]
MGDRVTRQFIDETTGDPITGGQFRLVSKTDTAYANITLVEIPDQTPGVPDGRYASPTTVQTGVYGIERYLNGAWEPTTDELTVEPGRWRNSGGGEMIVADYLEAVIRAGGHFGEGSNPDLVTLGTVLSYAHDEGFNTVVVGSFRGTKVWTGAAALVVPDGMFLDLAGATIQCSTPDVAAVLCDGSACIVNGTIACSGTGSAQHVTAGDPTKEISFIDVAFTGLAGTHATVTTAAGANARATFIACSNVVVPTIDATLSVAPQTVIGGRQNASQVNGDPFIPAAQANATATEIGDLVRFLQSAVAPAGSEIPPTSEPFTNMRQVAAAMRDLWFTQKPLISGAASATSVVYAKKDSDLGVSDPKTKITSISANAYGDSVNSNASISLNGVERKCIVIENGKFRSAKIYIAIGALHQFTFTPVINPQPINVSGSIEVNIADFISDLKSAFPSNSIKGLKIDYKEMVVGVSNIGGSPLYNGGSNSFVIPIVDPVSISLYRPVYPLYFYTPNTKAYNAKIVIEIDVEMFNESTANGLFQRYGTIASPSI